jgi:N-acetylglucosaminyl-diphospho-decaprenol L-rhamnosyltransferase
MSAVPAAEPRVRVVAVTFSPGAALTAFLDSLARATSAPYDVVLSDNGSTDGSIEAAEARPEVRVVRNEGNLGYGRAANAGVDATPPAAQEEWILVANPDVVFEPGSLDELLAAAERWPRAGAVGPAIRTPEGELYPSARAFPSVGRGIGHAVFGWWWPANPWTRAYRNERGTPVEGPVGWLSGSCLLVRRAAFAEVHGFDPSYFMYFEDLDLGRRLTDAGWASVHVPSALVTHTGGHATQRDPVVARQMLAAHHRSAWQYLSRQYAGVRFAPLRAVLWLGLKARHVLGLLLPRLGGGAQPTRDLSVLDAAVPSEDAGARISSR